MIKAGIVLDTYKLPIFERRLTGASFNYTKEGKFTKDGLTYVVTVHLEQNDLPRLAQVISAANKEAKKRARA